MSGRFLCVCVRVRPLGGDKTDDVSAKTTAVKKKKSRDSKPTKGQDKDSQKKQNEAKVT